MKKVFLFDLDSTITKEEILPTIAKRIGKEKEMKELSEKTMMGDLTFHESFTSRVEILKNIPVSEIAEIISNISVSEKLQEFLQEEKENCYIVTSNLDVWIEKLINKLGMKEHCFCSKAIMKDNKIEKIDNILIKENVLDEFQEKTIAIGDGSNDRNIIEKAAIGIAYGGVRNIAPSLLAVADYAIYDENKLYNFLKLLKED